MHDASSLTVLHVIFCCLYTRGFTDISYKGIYRQVARERVEREVLAGAEKGLVHFVECASIQLPCFRRESLQVLVGTKKGRALESVTGDRKGGAKRGSDAV